MAILGGLGYVGLIGRPSRHLRISTLVPEFLFDTTPNAFGFTDVNNVDPATLTLSNIIAINGIDHETPWSVTGTGAAMRVQSGGVWGSWGTSGVLNNNDNAQVRITSSVMGNTPVDVNIDIGGVTDTWTVRTKVISASADVLQFEVCGPTSLDPAGSPAYGVDGNGWLARIRLTALSGAVLDASKILITVADEGWEKSGGGVSATTRYRYITPSAVLRRPAPNQATQLSMVSGAIAAPTVGQPVDYFLTLSNEDHIYQGSTIVGVEVAAGFYGAAAAGSVSGPVNSSTWQYQDPGHGFFNTPCERVTGGSIAVELEVFHRHAMNGQSVAGVELFATDGTNVSASVFVNLPELSSLQTVGDIAEVYKATISTTALNQAVASSLCTVDAKIYPWIGSPYTISTQGAAWPTPQPCTVLPFVNDKTGAYGGAIACVKAGVTGGAVSTSIATARAAPFPTINAAITAIATWNNTVSGSHIATHNDYSGATIYLMDNAGADQGHELTGTVSTAAGTCWLDIKADPNNSGRAFYSMVNSRRVDGGMFRISCDIDKTGATGALSCNDTAQGSNKMLAVQNATVSLTAGTTNPYLISAGLVYQRNVIYPVALGQNVPALGTHSTSGMRCSKAIGIEYGDSATTQSVNIVPYMCVGLKGKFVVTTPSTSSQSTNDGGIVYNCRLHAISVTMNILGSAFEISRGFEFSQSVVEFISGQDFGISAGSSTANIKNVRVFGLTVPPAAGNPSADVGRFNHAYNDDAATRGKNCDIVVKYNILGRGATKSDYFSYYNSGGVVGNVGNFSVAYNVASRGNIMAFNRPATLDGSEYFRKVFDSKTAVGVGEIPFVDNKAGTTGATGFGNYRLTGGSNPAYDVVEAGLGWRRYDLAGLPCNNDGTGAAGPYEKAA